MTLEHSINCCEIHLCVCVGVHVHNARQWTMLRHVLAVIRHMSHAWLTEVYAVTEMSSSIFSTEQREPDHGSHFVLECSQKHTHITLTP